MSAMNSMNAVKDMNDMNAMNDMNQQCRTALASCAAEFAPPADAWECAGVQPQALRGVLGNYPTGVAIVTTCAADGRHVGLTINSFASLSLEPPLVLWSLVNHSPNLAVFRNCTHFAINVLAREHEDLARRFANPAVADKFNGVALRQAPEGIPALAQAIATLVCVHDHSRTVGDHLLMVGRVVRTACQPGQPLVFHGGRFASVAHQEYPD